MPTSEQEVAVRAVLREGDVFREALRAAIYDMRAEEQARLQAEALFARLWPTCDLGLVVALDRGSVEELCPDVPVPLPSSDLRLEDRVHSVCGELVRDDPAFHGFKLRKEIKSEMKRHVTVVRDEWNNSRAPYDPTRVKRVAIMLLADACREACLARSLSDDELRRRLKILAALTTFPSDVPATRAETIRGITDGRTASFPYVPKLLIRNEVPTVERFEGDQPVDLSSLATLRNLYLPTVHIEDCLTRYLDRRGVLSKYLDVDAPATPEQQREFDALPRFVQDVGKRILLPTTHLIKEHRGARYSLPDGVVAAVALAILLEWTLRQAVWTINGKTVPIGPTLLAKRGTRLFQELEAKGVIGPATIALLSTVFSETSLGVRDGLAHGIFFADEPLLITQTLGGLSRTLASLVGDLRRHHPTALQPPTWDATRLVDPAITGTLADAYAHAHLLNGVLPQDLPRMRRALFDQMKALTPDKRNIGWGAFYLWFEHERHNTGDPTEEFVATIASLIVFEEFLRAVAEVAGEATLRTSPAGKDGVNCLLRIMGTGPHDLLDPATLARMLQTHYSAGLQTQFAALDAVRIHAFHGEASALVAIPPRHLTHLTFKLMHELLRARALT